MIRNKFIYKLNWRQILIHLIACWFFINAFHTLAALYDIDLVNIYRKMRFPIKMEQLKDLNFSFERDYLLTRFTFYCKLAGLITAFIISLLIAREHKWSWINSFLVFLLSLPFITRYDGWRFVQLIILKPARLFDLSTTLEYLINGSILFLLGSLLFFLTILNRSIQKDYFVLEGKEPQ